MEAISGLEKNDSDAGISTKREKKKRNASVSATHSHSCEVSTPLCYTSAATGCPLMHDEHEDNDLTVGTLQIPTLTDLKWCCKGVSKCGSLEITQRPSKTRVSITERTESECYLEAAYDLWTIALEIGSWGRSYYPPRAVRHFGIRRFFL